ncbi:MlaD family protein [[Mycobacterium] wendilense]|uniref:MlaD family protein n=1 Tax=[Mycobacterium] wendilense TaxID=3064284 RepID=A0ABN9P7B3_9MYCO|nr:MlaD family protein [Mycolicibacterium sp. MU0050]CAJ1586077.1 MlaD family protein [Mycolicibacterium sp. MU0050]
MRLSRNTRIQLLVLLAVTATAVAVMLFGLVRLPSLVGLGRYTVTVELPAAAGLYERANVTYRGTEVGEVRAVNLTPDNVEAVLSLRSDIQIPSDLVAEVHSVSAVGEQYVALSPRTADAPPLRDGDRVPADRTTTPVDINDLLDATNRGLKAIPGDNLRNLVDESYIAFNGLGPDISRLIKGTTSLAADADKSLPELLNVTDNIAPLLNTQTETSDSLRQWARRLADISGQLRDRDADVQGIVRDAAAGGDKVRELFDSLQMTVPILAANLAGVAPVMVTYRPALEQILVLLPQGVAAVQAIAVANRFSKQAYNGSFLSFNLNFNLPPVCSTGFLPAQQRRSPALEDYPDRPTGHLYCRVPQDSQFNVRGARNLPCVTRPGKRAPTVEMCESDENYVPLNDGLNWKGDPNATLSGQAIPEQPFATSPAAQAHPIAIAPYDPATGMYVTPDGQVLHQRDLEQTKDPKRSWQSMLLPPEAGER